MLARGRGSLLVTTADNSVIPQPAFGNYAISGAAMRNWVLGLNKALAGLGNYAGHVAINHWIGRVRLKTPPRALAPTTSLPCTVTCTPTMTRPSTSSLIHLALASVRACAGQA